MWCIFCFCFVAPGVIAGVTVVNCAKAYGECWGLNGDGFSDFVMGSLAYKFICPK